MLSSITPFGERSRNSRWGLTVAFYLLGNVVGGIAIACVFGAIGLLVDPLIGDTTAVGILAVAGIVGVALELRLFGLRLPSYHRQVNEVWLTAFRGWVYGLGFGFQLGLGIATIVTTARKKTRPTSAPPPPRNWSRAVWPAIAASAAVMMPRRG